MSWSISRLFEKILFSGLVLMPLVNDGLISELTRVRFFWFWVWGLLVLVLIRGIFKKSVFEVNKKVSVGVFVWFFWIVISSFLGLDKVKSFWGNPYRLDGWLTLLHLIIFYLVLTYSSKFLKERGWRTVLSGIFWGSILVSFWNVVLGILVYVMGRSELMWIDGRLGASFSQPVFLGGYLLITLPLIYGYLTKSRLNWLIKSSCLGIVFLAIFLTGSKLAMFGVGLFFVWRILWVKIKNFNPITYGILSVLFLVMTVGGVLVYESWKTEYIAESRTRIWVKGILAAKERLWLGYGWANFDLAFDSIIWPIEYEGDVYVDKAHSHFLEIGVGGGLIGLLLYFFIIWQMIVNLFRKKGDLSEMFLGGLFLFIWQTQLNVISIASEVVFWVMLAYSASNS